MSLETGFSSLWWLFFAHRVMLTDIRGHPEIKAFPVHVFINE